MTERSSVSSPSVDEDADAEETEREEEPGPPVSASLLGPDESARVRTLPARCPDHSKLFYRGKGNILKTNVFYIDDQPYRLQPSPFQRGLKTFLRTHRFLLTKRSRSYERIHYAYYERDPVARLPDFRPAYVGVLRFEGKRAVVERRAECPEPALPPMIVARYPDGHWYWITSRTPVHRCPRCGRLWAKKHDCNERRSAFYYHAVGKHGSELWQHVHFSCPAQSPHVRRLFVTYDIETYTVFERKGKRMQPFMLCFMLSGDPDLVRRARRIALQDDDAVRALDEGFYWLDVEPGSVARRFRAFRTRLQVHFARDLVDRFLQHNPEYRDALLDTGQYDSVYDVPYELLEQPARPLTVPEDFHCVDIVVLGHNVCKFDEVLLATELVERRDLFPNACRCERSFMPRVGRLLFNDILFFLPNPNFLKNDPTRLDRWALGDVQPRDLRSLFVRFMVRDTLQLTSGAKLAKAASAYALRHSKGECPYQAVNEFVSLGAFEADADGFPVARYWEDPSVIDEQKRLWAEAHGDAPYDLVRACLEYCMQDVRVTQALAHTLLENYAKYFRQELGMHGDFNIFVRPTIPSNTHAFWKQLAFSRYVRERRDAPPPPPRTAAPRAADPSRPRKRGRPAKPKQIPADYLAEVYAPHRPMFKYIRQALRGGRCYPTILGPYRRPVYVFDICGMYASALTHPMPHGMPLDPFFCARHVDELNRLLAAERPVSYFDPRVKPSIVKIEAYPPPPEQLDPLPPLCSRRGGRLVWTNEPLYDEVVTVLDALTLHNRGWTVTVLQDEMNIVFPEWKPICAEYVSINIRAKEKADREKNEVMRSISKMLSNALYGAFATNMDTCRVVFEQDLAGSDKADIYEGVTVVKHVTLLNDHSFSGRDVCLGGPADPDVDPFAAEHLARRFRPARRRRPETPEEPPDPDLDLDGPPEDGADDVDLGDESTRKDATLASSLTDEEDLPLSDVDAELADAAARPPPFIADAGGDGHAHSDRRDDDDLAGADAVRHKPVRFLDATPEALTVLHLESLDRHVENKRYATQIACFVLGWSRAFFSEWCDILHGPDRGVHPHLREPQTLYGDTDSIFTTESGYHRMKTRGAHRIKSPDTRLTFDPERPALYWACDCDIKCKRCGADTYASESVFLAPKLYGLKDAVCTDPRCGHVGDGKIRSKGHRQAELVFDTLSRCWQRHEDQLYGGTSRIQELHTRRNIFKTTLLNKVSRYQPFTIHNEQLVRVLRPWTDPTLYRHGDYLYPYDQQHPNPRTADEVRPLPPIDGDDEEALLADVREPYAFLSVEECDDLLELLQGADDDRDRDPEALP